MADDEVEIFCPKCRYRPVAEDRWSCVPSCQTKFHTFWTRGLCPGCGWNWTQTQCPQCGEISPHAQWYHPKHGARSEESRQREKVTHE